MKRSLLAATTLLGLIATIPMASAAPDEQLKAAAEKAKPALIETLHDMVMIESGSSDVDGLKKMADFTEARLKALGATTQRRKTTRGAGAAGERGRALAEEGKAIYAEIDRPLDIRGMSGGATDAGYANRSGKAAVVESFGLAGFNMHAHDEYIDTVSIVPRLYLMTRMLIEEGKKQ